MKGKCAEGAGEDRVAQALLPVRVLQASLRRQSARKPTKPHSQEWLCYSNLIHPAVVGIVRRLVLVVAHIDFKFTPGAAAFPVQVIVPETIEEQSPPEIQITNQC